MGDADLPDEHAGRSGPPLAYKTDTGTVTVRGFRLLLALTLLNTTLLGTIVLGPQLFPFLRQQWTQWRNERATRRAEAAALQARLALQQQCLTYTVPARTVVYEENPAEAEKILRDGGAGFVPAWGTTSAPTGWIPPVQAVMPKLFMDYQAAVFRSPNSQSLPLLFLHERTTPGGVKHVVVVYLSSSTQFTAMREAGGGAGEVSQVVTTQSKSRELLATAFPAGAGGPRAARSEFMRAGVPLVLPDTAEREVQRINGGPGRGKPEPVDYGNVLRIFAGQPDPNDPTHFTIDYQLDGRDGVIDGWLKDDAVELRPREGKWIFDGTERWKLTPPATRPVIYPSTAPAE
jgi:hypothetical protein